MNILDNLISLCRSCHLTIEPRDGIKGEARNIRVDDEVHRMISEEGKYGDSMNDILKRLLAELYDFRRGKRKK